MALTGIGSVIFTGSPTVGKIVSAAAAKHLTPITLELGGKNPLFYDPKMDPEVTARRLVRLSVQIAAKRKLIRV